jgi:hypothetical protein
MSSVSFSGEGAARTEVTTDTQWLQSLGWSAEIRGALKAAVAEGNGRDFVHSLVTRAPYSAMTPRAVGRGDGISWSELVRWGIEDVQAGVGGRAVEFFQDLEDLVELKTRKRRTRIVELIEAWSDRLSETVDVAPEELLVSLAALHRVGALLPTRSFLPFWRKIWTAAQPFVDGPPEQTEGSLRSLIIGAELRWWIAAFYWPLVRADEFTRRFDDLLFTHLDEITDDDGSPHAPILGDLPGIVASFARCLVLDRLRDAPAITDRTRGHFAKLVTCTSGLLDDRGRLLWDEKSQLLAPLLTTAARLSGLKKPSPARRWLARLQPTLDSRRSPAIKPVALPKAIRKLRSHQSDWAMTAAMASDESEVSSQVGCRFHDAAPEVIATINGRELVSGPWRSSVVIGGETLRDDLSWTCSCWYSDKAADFVEMQCRVRPGVTLFRQVLLGKRDSWMMLADEVRAPGQTIEYFSQTPIARGWDWLEDSLTRERALVQDSLRVRVAPIFVSQDKVQRSDGVVEPDARGLTLRFTAADGLYLPTVFDWHPDRRDAGVDWNVLTVADSGRVLSRSEASAYRLRVGERQWVFYHSLTRARVGRSVVGLHTLYETVVGEFKPNGVVDPMVQVEFSADSTDATQPG